MIRVSHVAQRAAAAALDGPQGWLDEVAERLPPRPGRRPRRRRRPPDPERGTAARDAVPLARARRALVGAPRRRGDRGRRRRGLRRTRVRASSLRRGSGGAGRAPRAPVRGRALIVRIGVLSDLHCELEPTGSRWINPFEPEQLDGRLDAALAWFAEAAVDLILVLGDLVQFANPGDLEHAFGRLAAADVAPLATVNGNHDLRLGDEFAASARRHGIRLLHEEPLVHDGVAVTGVGAAARGRRRRSTSGSRPTGTKTRRSSSSRRTSRSCPRPRRSPRPGSPTRVTL